MRHARASRVQIGVNLAGNALHISISDNGVGVRRARQSELTSLGIVGMKERIARIGGDFNLFSELGSGTRIELVIPVHHDQNLRRR
jgi:signal transduction histidine kinase